MKNKLFFMVGVLFFCTVNLTLAQEGQLPPSVSPPETLSEPAPSSQMPVAKATGQNKISLDIRGMDVVDVLKMLAGRAGLSIVVGKNVVGRVTLFLKDVDIWDAFEIVILANDLAYEKRGDIVNIMTQQDYMRLYGNFFQDKRQARIMQLKYAQAVDLSGALNQIKTNIGRIVVDAGSNTLVLIDTPEKIKEMEEFIKNTDLPIQTRVFSLNYALVEKISAKLQEAVTKGIGSIKIDERTNKIAITDYPKKLDEIAKIISAFDERTPQVLIDAQLIEIKPSDKLEMGVDWDYWIKKHFEVKASLPINTANTLFLGTTSGAPTEAGEYKAILDILRTIGDTKVLSSPRIMSLNNQEAKIHVGTRDAYITSTISQSGTGTTVTSQEVNFVDVGIQLSVTPTINRDGFITMKIKPEVSDATRTSITSEDKITQIPIVTTSEAETTVTVKDGITIIIGGLSKDKREKTVKKIPLLGDIPLIGFFFRSTSDNLTKTELVILLTPHIMSGETTYTDFSEIKPKDGVVVKLVEGEIVKEKISTPKPEETLRPLLSENETEREYHQLVTNKVNQSAKLHLPEGKTGWVEINFNISSEGSLIGEPQVLYATDSALIPFAIEAIKEASPFPSFPEDLEKEEERFHITLEYR